MNNINVEIGISDESLEKLTDAVSENLDINEQIDNYDFDDKFNNWFEYNVDISEYVTDALGDVNFKNYIDTDDFDIDVESDVRHLLESFTPINPCSTGEAAMKVIESTVRYLLLKNTDFVDDIQNALEKNKIKKMMEEAKTNIIEEAKPLLRSQFQMELSQYADAIEADKARQQAYASAGYTATTAFNNIPLDIV